MWNPGKSDGADLSVKAAATPSGKGLELAFDLSKGDWVQVWQDVEIDLAGLTGVRLNLRLTGASNRLEVKLVDADGTNFGVRLDDLAFDGKWRERYISWPQFEYFWGGEDKKLDLSRITSVWLAFVKLGGGRGVVAVDRVEMDIEKKPDKSTSQGLTQQSVRVDLDDPAAWEISAEAGAEIRAARADNNEGLVLAYKLDTGNWAQVHRSLPPDLRGLTAVRMKVRQRGGHNRIELKLADEDGSNFGYNFEDIPRNDQWIVRKVAFKDFVYFWGGDAALDLAKLNSVWIAVSRLEGGEGRIVIGSLDIEREPPAGAAPVGAAAAKPDGGVCFDMEKAADWSPEHAVGSDLKVHSIEGFKGRAVELDYELGAGGWVQVSHQKKMDLSAIQKVSFNIRMTGNRNALEIKLVDADGTNFGVRLDDIPAGEDWRRIEIPIRRFSYFWGGNEGMDWPNAASIWFAVSTIDGGAGKLALDDVELIAP